MEVIVVGGIVTMDLSCCGKSTMYDGSGALVNVHCFIVGILSSGNGMAATANFSCCGKSPMEVGW